MQAKSSRTRAPSRRRLDAEGQGTILVKHGAITLAFLGMAGLWIVPRTMAQSAPQDAGVLLSEEQQERLKDAAAILHDAERAYSAGDYGTAEREANSSFELRRRILGSLDPLTLSALSDFAAAVSKRGDYAKAESLYRDIYAEQARSPGAGNPKTLATLNNLAAAVISEGRYAEGEKLARQVHNAAVHVLGAEDSLTLKALDNLGAAILQQRRFQEAESLLRQLYTIRRRIDGPDSPQTLTALHNLARAVEAQGRHAEAEQLGETINDRRSAVIGADHPDTIASLADMAMAMEGEHRYVEAELLLRRAAAASIRRLGADHPDTLRMFSSLAHVLHSDRHYGEAATAYRHACLGLSRRASAIAENSAAGARTVAANCFYELALDLWDLQAHGVGSLSSDAPLTDIGDAALGLEETSAAPNSADLGSEAFDASQRANQSQAASALSRNGALAIASSSGVGALAARYEQSVDERQALQREFAEIPSGDDRAEPAERQSVLARIHGLDGVIEELSAEVRRQAPSYWNYRSPESLNLASLQSGILHQDEALILWVCAADESAGLVFAVSRERFGWAQLGLSGNEIAAHVRALRAEVENRESGVSPLASFQRETAHGLYAALLGAPAIQDVIANKRTLLIVPSGALASLPPSLLVVSAPAGGVAGDSDPQSLRRTHWLITDKSIAILPGVAALAALRRWTPRAPVASEPLLAFADPDFHRAGGQAPASTGSWLASLEPLPETRAEAEALRAALHAPKDSVLLGRRASKTELEFRARNGSLARVQALVFATHGFSAGEVPGVSEPALALAAPSSGTDESDDGLLRASEVATLKLNADWVVLSACNTAGADQLGEQSLSGLSRAFFYAGARTLLVSHWRVRDDAAMRLVTGTFRERQQNPGLNKAQALRESMLKLMNDKSLDDGRSTYADPSAWAPFVLVGDDD